MNIALHDFDPNLIFRPEQPDDVCYISLSDRWDLYVILDRQDYEWAKHTKWGHTYGSGSLVECFEGVLCIERPDHIYANYRTGGKAIWLHREICTRAYGPSRYRRAIGDHMNGNTLDCRRRNLRWATRRMNARNTPNSAVRRKFLKQMGA